MTARRLSATGRWKTPLFLAAIACSMALAGCSQTTSSISAASLTDAVTPSILKSHGYRYTSRDKECLQRAMFFESRRSSREGMIAVGTVVMNRLKSGQHGDSICAVVGERGQFAPGVLTRRMNSKAMPDVEEAAEAVLKGERAPKLKNAMHFHTAGLKFPYKNMHYVEVAGGNAFYEKRGRNWQPLPDDSQFAIASAAPAVEAPATPEVLMASAAPVPTARTATASTTQPMPEGEAVLAMRQPDPTRFGSALAPGFDTANASVLVMTASATVSQPVMTFQATPDNTDAIGAMIMSQTRPLNE